MHTFVRIMQNFIIRNICSAHDRTYGRRLFAFFVRNRLCAFRRNADVAHYNTEKRRYN